MIFFFCNRTSEMLPSIWVFDISRKSFVLSICLPKQINGIVSEVHVDIISFLFLKLRKFLEALGIGTTQFFAIHFHFRPMCLVLFRILNMYFAYFIFSCSYISKSSHFWRFTLKMTTKIKTNKDQSYQISCIFLKQIYNSSRFRRGEVWWKFRPKGKTW